MTATRGGAAWVAAIAVAACLGGCGGDSADDSGTSRADTATGAQKSTLVELRKRCAGIAAGAPTDQQTLSRLRSRARALLAREQAFGGALGGSLPGVDKGQAVRIRALAQAHRTLAALYERVAEGTGRQPGSRAVMATFEDRVRTLVNQAGLPECGLPVAPVSSGRGG